MPTVFRHDGARFFFYSNEGDPREPRHVHVESGDGVAKLWLDPTPSVASSDGYSRRRLADIVAIVTARQDDIRRSWDEHFR